MSDDHDAAGAMSFISETGHPGNPDPHIARRYVHRRT
jgi:hypothetical protein